MKAFVVIIAASIICSAQNNIDLERPATYRELRNLSWGMGERLTDLEDSLRSFKKIIQNHEDYVNSNYIIQIENHKKDSAAKQIYSKNKNVLDDLSKKGNIIEVLVYLLGTYITGHASLKFLKSKTFGSILVAVGNVLKKGDKGKNGNG